MFGFLKKKNISGKVDKVLPYNRRITLMIYHPDGKRSGFKTARLFQENVTFWGISEFKRFYLWYFFRDNSEVFVFNNSDGVSVIRRDDITRFQILYKSEHI